MSKNRVPVTDEKTPRAGKRSGEKLRLPRWRLIMIILCLLGFLAFCTPLAGGILNIANVAAMSGFLLLAAAFRWWPELLRLLGKIWAKPLGKVLLLAVGVGSAAVILTLAVLFCLVATKLWASPKEPCPTVIVLGCQVKGRAPSLLLSFRIEAAADYLEANPEASAILTGGMGPGEDVTEASCMFEALTARGIDPARLYLEEEARNTRENLEFSKALMEREGLRGPAAIISNDFHIYRALQVAEDLDLPAWGLAARSNWYSRPTYMLREAMALVRDALAD